MRVPVFFRQYDSEVDPRVQPRSRAYKTTHPTGLVSSHAYSVAHGDGWHMTVLGPGLVKLNGYATTADSDGQGLSNGTGFACSAGEWIFGVDAVPKQLLALLQVEWATAKVSTKELVRLLADLQRADDKSELVYFLMLKFGL